MPIIQLSDGTRVQIPDSPPEEKPGAPDWVRKPLASLSGGAGQGVTGLAGLPIAITRLLDKGLKAVGLDTDSLPGQQGKSAKLHAENSLDRAYGAFRQLGKEGLEGVPGEIVQGAGEGMAGGVPGMVAGAVSRPVQAKVSGAYGPIAGALAGMAAGGAAGYAASPAGLSFAQSQIKEAAHSPTAAQIAEAVKNRALLHRTGAETATLPELFPGNTSLKALALETARARGGEALQSKLAGREADLTNLTNTFIRRAGPEVSPARVANSAAAAADDVVEGLRRFRSQGTAAHMAGAEVPAQTVKDLVSYLKSARNVEARPGLQKAYDEIISSFESLVKERPFAKVQDLSGQIKGLTVKPAGLDASAKALWNQGDMKEALKVAQQGLEEVAPSYKSAMQFYRDYTTGPVKEAREGIIGALSNRNPYNTTVTPVSRLNSIVKDQVPQDVSKSMAMLASKGADPAEIASAVVRHRLGKGSTNPSQALYGKEGSLEQQNLAALFQAGGKGPNAVFEPVRAADLLQGMQGQPSRSNDFLQSAMAFVAQPYASLKNTFNQAARAKNYGEIAEILKDPKNLEMLQQIAMHDTQTRRALTMYGIVAPLTRLQGE